METIETTNTIPYVDLYNHLHLKIQQDYENILDFLLKNPYIIDINWHRETDWTDNQNKTIKTLKQII